MLRVQNSENTSQLEQWLASEKPEEKLLAHETLTGMGREATREYLWQITEREEKKRRKRGYYLIAVSFPAYIIASLALRVFCHTFFGSRGSIATNALSFVYVLFTSHQISIGPEPNPLHQQAMFRLAALGDLRAAKAMLRWWLAVNRSRYCRELLQLLPRFSATDQDVLSAEEWRRLAGSITTRLEQRHAEDRDVAFCLAVLKAVFTAAPDKLCRQTLERLAKRKATTPEAERVRTAAENYLTLLRNAPTETNA